MVKGMTEMIAGIFARPHITDTDMVRKLISDLVHQLKDENVVCRLDRYAAGYINQTEDSLDGMDVAIVLGGDGTILTAAQHIPEHVPVLAINLGNLGFLTTTTSDQIGPAVSRLIKSPVQTLNRTFVDANIFFGDLPQKTLTGINQALNDVVIKATDSGRTLSFHISIDNKPVAKYKADGVIISTPTGSTAYSLAAGGPIIYPTLKALVITPICPHTLTFRPVVVPDNLEISIVSEPAHLFLDGKRVANIDSDFEIRCKLSKKMIRLIEPEHMPYFSVLKEKLRWGI